MDLKSSHPAPFNLKFDSEEDMVNELKSISKTESELRVSNYMVLFGGSDLVGEFFTESTSFKSAYTESGAIHVDFEHGLDPDKLGIGPQDIIGRIDWKTAKIDEKGIFVERVLNRQAKYMSALESLIDEKRIGTSSACIPGESHRKSTGEITVWPIMRDSLTLTPCEPRMIKGNTVEAIRELKSYFPDSKSLSDGLPYNFSSIKTIRDLEMVIRDEFNVSKSVATNFLSHAKRVLSGDLPKHEKQISELKNRLNQYQVESLMKTLNKLGN